MSHERLTIGDIQTADHVYYDPGYVEQCYQYCADRDIDCLPEIGDENSFYQRVDQKKGFKKQTISDDRKLDGSTFLFNPNLLDRFKKHAVQFVYANGEMTGVVHFSDYNKDVVNTYLYGQIARYERDLRQLAELCGLTNENMLDHFRAMAGKARDDNGRQAFEGKIVAFERNREDLNRQEEFITFYLKDLIGLANRQKVIHLDDSVNELRKQIMHAGVLVEMADAHTPDYIYKIDSFTRFFKLVLLLLKDGRRIRNRLTIKRTLDKIAFDSRDVGNNSGELQEK